LYQPSATTLFALIVAAAGVFGVIYSSFAVVHSVVLGPTDERIRSEWLTRQSFQEREAAKKAAAVLMLTSLVPIAVGVGLRLKDIHAQPTTSTVNVVVGIAIILILISPFLAVLRTTPSRTAADQIGLRLSEVYGANFAVSGFVLLLLMVLP
jgi:hypothetical protein